MFDYVRLTNPSEKEVAFYMNKGYILHSVTTVENKQSSIMSLLYHMIIKRDAEVIEDINTLYH